MLTSTGIAPAPCAPSRITGTSTSASSAGAISPVIQRRARRRRASSSRVHGVGELARTAPRGPSRRAWRAAISGPSSPGCSVSEVTISSPGPRSSPASTDPSPSLVALVSATSSTRAAEHPRVARAQLVLQLGRRVEVRARTALRRALRVERRLRRSTAARGTGPSVPAFRYAMLLEDRELGHGRAIAAAEPTSARRPARATGPPARRARRALVLLGLGGVRRGCRCRRRLPRLERELVLAVEPVAGVGRGVAAGLAGGDRLHRRRGGRGVRLALRPRMRARISCGDCLAGARARRAAETVEAACEPHGAGGEVALQVGDLRACIWARTVRWPATERAGRRVGGRRPRRRARRGAASSEPASASAVVVFLIFTSSAARARARQAERVQVPRTASTRGPIPLVALKCARRMARGGNPTVAAHQGSNRLHEQRIKLPR